MKELKDSLVSAKRQVYKDFLARRYKGLKTGITGLDRYLRGLGDVISIQGETSSCKSTLALQIVHHNLKLGIPCLMLDKENGDGRIINRMICQAHRISEDELKDLDEETRTRYAEDVFKLPLHIHTERIKSKDILEERLAECWNHYKKPFMLLIDSMQAMERFVDDQRLGIEEWFNLLEQLKLLYAGKLTIVFVSEKNRFSYGQQGMGGGKGSNSFDYKPETVIDVKWNGADDDTYTLQIGKHRDGLRGELFHLQKTLSQPENPRSFCFLLEEIASI